MKIPKAVDAWFANPQNGDEQKIAALIEDFNDKVIAKFEQEIFKQRKRVADARTNPAGQDHEEGHRRRPDRL